MKYKIYKLKCKTCLYIFTKKTKNLNNVVKCPKCGILNIEKNLVNNEIKCLLNKIIERYYVCINILKRI